MMCISMTNDEKFNLFTGFLSVSHYLFSAFWRAENSIYTQKFNRSCPFYGHKVITNENKESRKMCRTPCTISRTQDSMHCKLSLLE